jgi:hypothetical protein
LAIVQESLEFFIREFFLLIFLGLEIIVVAYCQFPFYEAKHRKIFILLNYLIIEKGPEEGKIKNPKRCLLVKSFLYSFAIFVFGQFQVILM